MCYVRSGLPVTVEDKYFTPYISGTKPIEFVKEEDVEAIKINADFFGRSATG